MKLQVDLSLLESAVIQMGAPLIDFKTSTKFGHVDIDKILGTTSGQTISLEDITVNMDASELLEYKGRQVLLFIPDQGNRIDNVIEDATRGTKFHICDCKTLQEMRATNRYNKYAVTNNLTGIFDIYGTSYQTNEEKNIQSKLYVCKNCLNKLNYKNYQDNKTQVFNQFKISEFFETYSTLFEYLPNIKNDGNTLTREDQSINPTKSSTCCECDTTFPANSKLIINVDKKSICLDCYRKQTKHKTAFITNSEIKEIYKNRTEQKMVKIKSWNDVYKYVDISIHGYINRLKYSFPTPPTTVGYIPEENKNLVLDLVWITNSKKAALVTKRLPEYENLKGWKIVTLGEAMRKL